MTRSFAAGFTHQRHRFFDSLVGRGLASGGWVTLSQGQALKLNTSKN
jgi:hypothetical protein